MIIADTGFWIALANRSNSWHQRAAEVLDDINEPLITTWPVLTETCHILLKRLGSAALLSFMKSFDDSAFEVVNIKEDQKGELLRLMKKYRELPMDLADASLVILAEHLGHGRIVSTDTRDFKTYKWKQRKPFKNILTRAL
jgi:predicted nucleic acid-binding protein